MRNMYKNGATILGAPAVQPETNRAILIRVKNAGEVARSQGALATIAQSLAPATVEAKVYDAMRDQLAQSLASNHVDADVTVVEPKAYQSADGKHVWQDLAIGVGLIGVAAFAWKIATGAFPFVHVHPKGR